MDAQSGIENSFVDLLEQSENDDVSLFNNGSAIPLVTDAVMHLKLLYSFRRLKDIVTIQINNILDREKLWQCYLTIAVRRFNIFVSALHLKFHDNQPFVGFMNSILPPIDILIVWHSFLLNPKSFYDNFNINDFMIFAKYPFPLRRICQDISDKDFIFSPSIEVIDDFTLFIEDFFVKINVHDRFNYNSYQPFDPSTIKLVLLCPNCHRKLPRCDLTNSDSTGYADSNFELKYKCCSFSSTVTHNELRKRKLYTDCRKPNKIPSIIKHYSSKINKSWKEGVSPELIDSNIKDQTLDSYSKGLDILNFANTRYSYADLLVLRDYLELNPIYMTIPTRVAFPIHEDLVACIKRQENFIDTIIELDWLRSSVREHSMLEARLRYENFFSLIKIAKHPVVPTLDIDLMWHTHQLFQVKYFEYCKEITRNVVDHNDKIEVNRLDTSFEKTCKLYKTMFKQDYSVCFCWYCTRNRINRFKIFNDVIRKSNFNTSGNPIKNENLSIFHISCHNSIKIPTERSRIFDKRLRTKYNLRPQDYVVRPLPWDFKDSSSSSTSYFSDDDDLHLRLYKNGLCLTAFDTASMCGGLRGGCGYFEESKASCIGKGVSSDPSICGSGFIMPNVTKNSSKYGH